MVMATLVCLYIDNLNVAFGVAAISLVTVLSKFSLAEISNWPNGVTLVRFVGICISLLLISDPWTLGICLTIMVLLDVLDGYLARKLNQSSTLGMHLDMEVDACFVLIMCLFYYLKRDVAFWILIPGLLRYLYVIYINLFPKPAFVETKQKYASIIAGVFFTLLLIGIVVPDNYLTFILLPGTVAIIISFGISFIQHLKWSPQSLKGGQSVEK